MSFDIFLVCLRGGKEEPIPRELFESIFLPNAPIPTLTKKMATWWSSIPMAAALAYIPATTKKIKKHWSNIMLNHFGGDAFYTDMYKLAHITKSIIFWPTNRPIYLYTDPSVPAELKGIEYFEEARGVFIRIGAEIDGAIGST